MLTRPEPRVLVRLTRCSSPPERLLARAVEREVIEPDLAKVAESAIDLSQDSGRDRLTPEIGQTDEEAAGVADRQGRKRRQCRGRSILTARASGRSRAP